MTLVYITPTSLLGLFGCKHAMVITKTDKGRKVYQVIFSNRLDNQMELNFLEKLLKRDFLIWKRHPWCFLQLVPNVRSSSNHLVSLKLETMVTREIECLQVLKVFVEMPQWPWTGCLCTSGTCDTQLIFKELKALPIYCFITF